MMSLRGQKQERRCMRGQGSPLWKRAFDPRSKQRRKGAMEIFDRRMKDTHLSLFALSRSSPSTEHRGQCKKYLRDNS